MRIKSVTKINRHKRFQYKPRYYDPVAEDIEHRYARVREKQEGNSYTATGFKGAFIRKKTNSSRQLFVTVIALILLTTILGWVYIGNKIFYISFSLALPPYLIWKFKNRKGING